MAENQQTSNTTVFSPMLGEKLTWRKKFRKGLKEYGYLSISFLVPVVLMYLIYLAMEIYPFGEGSVLVLDLNGQYVSFYEGLRNFIYGDMSLLYSFSRSLGGEFMGMYAYYLASPFSYIVALFPQARILEALLTIFLIKTGMCGFTFGLYLHKTSRHKPSFNKVNVIVFSIMYALSAYCIVQQHNSMWIDAVIWLPLIAYGIEELIKKGHYKLYIIMLSLTIMSNFYIGWMTCIFSAVYFFAYYFMHNEKNRNNPYREKAHFAKSFLRMMFFSIIAVAIAGLIILTAYYSLTFGKTSFSNTNWSFFIRSDVLDMFVKMLPGSYDTVRPEGLPFIYCGVLTLILIPVYFCSGRYSTREKVLYGCLIAFFLLSFLINPVDLVWHGFQMPVWLNYRYSFMLCFVLLTIAYKGITEIKRSSVVPLVSVSGMLILLAGIVQKLDLKTFVLGDGKNDRHHEVGKLLTLECIWLTIACVAVYLLLLCVMRRTKKIQNIALILVVIVSVEFFCNGLTNCLDLGSDVVYTSYTTYHNTMDPLRDTTSVVKNSDNGFYRLETLSHRKANSSIALNTYGLTGSTSTLNATTINYLHNMGYLGKSHESRYYGANPTPDSLLGIKYVLAGISDNTAEFNNAKELLADERLYSQYYSDDSYTVYRNLYALSLAYAVNSSIENVDLAQYCNPYDSANAIVTAMLGESETVQVFKPIENVSLNTANISISGSSSAGKNYRFPYTKYAKLSSSTEASLTYILSLPYIDTTEENQLAIQEQKESDSDNVTISPETQYVYFYFPTEFARSFTFASPAGSYGSVYASFGDMRTLFVGKLNEGEEHTVKLSLDKDELYLTKDVPLFYYLDYDVYVDVMEKLSEAQLEIEEGFTDSHLEGSITTTSDNSTIFTSIPYDSGWIVKVDGKKVDTLGILGDSDFENASSTGGSVISFKISEAGTHTVELIYRPWAFTLGLTLSLVGIIALILLTIFEKRINKFTGRFLMPLTIPEIPPEEPEMPAETDKTAMLPVVHSIPPATPPTQPVGKGMESATPLHAMHFEEATLLGDEDKADAVEPLDIAEQPSQPENNDSDTHGDENDKGDI